MPKPQKTTWDIFRAPQGVPVDPHNGVEALASSPAPTWRRFAPLPEDETSWPEQGAAPLPFLFEPEEVDLINAALHLRRPLLITGRPGCGKSSIAYAVAYQLRLGPVLRWNINTRSTLKDGLYSYDAIARLQAKDAGDGSNEIEKFMALGPLGMALTPSHRPRALLIDEIDKSDIDFPNDLLNVLETGSFTIKELDRIKESRNRVTLRHTLDRQQAGQDNTLSAEITNGHVQCAAFPFVVMTSNGERSFPAPFLRRCIRLDIKQPNQEKLARIVKAKLGEDVDAQGLVNSFFAQSQEGLLATDQLLNAVYLMTQCQAEGKALDVERLKAALYRRLDRE